MSVGCVYSLIAAGKIAHARIGLGRGTIRVPEASIELYLDSVLQGPMENGPRMPTALSSGFTNLDGSRLQDAWRRQGVG